LFDWLLSEHHAIAILKKDHETVKDLFDQFEKAEKTAAKEKIVTQALNELKLHAAIEEEIFYPTVRAHVGSKVMNEADEEHHVARVLIAELDRDGDEYGHREAKFTVLAENVRHHIREEESDMLPKAKELDIDFEALGQRMLDRKADLTKNGFSPDTEHRMVSKAGGKGDSPAAAAANHTRAAASRRSAAKGPTKTAQGRTRKTTSRSKD